MDSFFKFRRFIHILALLAIVLFIISLFVWENAAFFIGMLAIIALDFILLLISALKYKVVTFSGNTRDIENKKVFASDVIMIIFEFLVIVGILQIVVIPILQNIQEEQIQQKVSSHGGYLGIECNSDDLWDARFENGAGVARFSLVYLGENKSDSIEILLEGDFTESYRLPLAPPFCERHWDEEENRKTSYPDYPCIKFDKLENGKGLAIFIQTPGDQVEFHNGLIKIDYTNQLGQKVQDTIKCETYLI